MLMECPLFQHKSFSKLQLLLQIGINRRGRRRSMVVVMCHMLWDEIRTIKL